MKILIIYPTLTHPIAAGNKQWVMAQVDELKKLGHEVYMLCINVPGVKEDTKQNSLEYQLTKNYWGDYGFIYNASKYQRIKNALYQNLRKKFFNGYFKCDDLYPQGLTQYVQKINSVHHFDACIVNYYWLTKALKYIDVKIKALNTHDVFAYKDMVVKAKNPWMATTPNEEGKATQRADYAFALQDEEAAYYERIAPKTKVLNVYCPYQIKEQPLTYNHNLVILSSSNVLNIEGFEWFCKEIYPAIIAEFPDVNLMIGGYICKKLQDYSNKPHFKLIGEVEDPADLYKLGDVAINPCKNGTGLKIKTFEALSFGKVAMTHPHSTIGIYQKQTAPVFASEAAEDWVRFLKEIWGDNAVLQERSKKSTLYIDKMNKHITEQYKIFCNE